MNRIIRFINIPGCLRGLVCTGILALSPKTKTRAETAVLVSSVEYSPNRLQRFQDFVMKTNQPSQLASFSFLIKCLSELCELQEGVSEGACWRSASRFLGCAQLQPASTLRCSSFPEFARGPGRPAPSNAGPEARAGRRPVRLTPLPPLAFPEVPAHASATPPRRSHAPASELLGSCHEGRQRRVDARMLEPDHETALSCGCY